MWMLWLNKPEALFLLKAMMRERERFGGLAELRALLQLVHCSQFPAFLVELSPAGFAQERARSVEGL